MQINERALFKETINMCIINSALLFYRKTRDVKLLIGFTEIIMLG